VVQASRWQIPALILIRNPKDAVLSFVVRDPISLGLALKYYISFYETVADYRDTLVLGTFEEVTSNYGSVIERVNEKFGTTFLPFQNNERSVRELFARMEKNYRKRNPETSLEAKISRPSTAREVIKRRMEHELRRTRYRDLISDAESVYRRLTGS
jgi:hypothetical protein